MCKFIAEVMKVKDGSDYPGKTLYQICVSIQKHLKQAGVHWKLVQGDDFTDLRMTLDNLMKQRAVNNFGTTTKQAQVIPLNVQDKMWNDGILGEYTPDKLHKTVCLLIRMNVGLRASDEHYALCRPSESKPSQITFKTDSKGQKCMVYIEDIITKRNDGGLKSMRNEHKVVWVYPSSNTDKCPMRLVEKYLSLLPPITPQTKKF